MDVVKGHLSESGTLSLPEAMRQELGLPKGGSITLQAKDGVISIRSAHDGVARAQALYREMLDGKPGTSVDEFLEWRKHDGRP